MIKSLFDEMVQLEKNINDFFQGYSDVRRNSGYPVINVLETDESFDLLAVMPGVKKEDVDISMEKGILTIKGIKKSDRKDNTNYIRNERSFGEFQKSIQVGPNIDVNHIQASYKNGLLLITMKKEEKAKPKKIAVV